MNISITFRHMDSSSAVKAYAGEKVSKLQKFLRLPMTAKVTLSIDKLRHLAEARISSGGQRFDASEASEDMYASIDMIIDKLERQIRGTKGAKQARSRRGPRPVEPAAAKPAAAPKAAVEAPPEEPAARPARRAVKPRVRTVRAASGPAAARPRPARPSRKR
jgi:putative sigma-54 modulation protein